MKGKIISDDNLPMKDVKILAYDYDFFPNPEDFLGEASTDSDGLFEITFDKSRFNGSLEFIEGTPEIFLIVKDAKGKELMRTNPIKTEKEIEYHIKVTDQRMADPNAKDIYADNGRRIIAMLKEVGNLVDLENRINQENSKRREDFLNRFEERRNNFNHFITILTSIVDSQLEELRIGDIGYDGPQVKRHPRRILYNQIITWRRMEEFKWA